MYKQQLLIRPPFLIALLSFVFASAAVANPVSQATVDGTSPFRVTPDALAAENVPLGQTHQVQLVINNDDSVAHTPVLYKARNGSPDGAVMQQVEAPQPQHVPLPQQAARVDPAIADDLAAAPDGQAEFLVFLNEQPDLSAAYRIADWEERGWFVYRTLYSNAERKQQSLRAWLDARGVAYDPLWIVNALVVRGSSADLQALAARADVALVRANHAVALDAAPLTRPMKLLQQQSQLANVPSSCEANERGICWNILQIGAERVWSEFGVSGEGITVANIDSGVDYDHPALLQQYRGYQGSGNVDHAYSWFAPQGRSAIPVDSNGSSHGTHTMGTMVGRGDGSATQPAVGVAPGARWIAAQGCRNTECLDSDLLESAQWLLAPTDPYGQAPRPDLRPQVINNSWAGPGGDKSYAGYITAWRAAGIFPVFAAGNFSNATCSTVGSPGDYENVVAVGSTTQDNKISYFSSTGPAKSGRLKPDITAPGSGIASTIAGDSLRYGTLSGTSMATPHIAGVVALMMAANPALIGDYETIYSILAQTAVPMTDERFNQAQYAACVADAQLPNNVFGYGLVDAYAAVAQAQVDVPWLELPTDLPAIAPGAALPISVTVDARRVSGPGTYRARLLISADDLSEPPLSIDVTMTVSGDGSQIVVQGSVTDTETGGPVRATIDVDDGPTLTTDIMGAFTVTLPGRSEPYTFSANALGYIGQSVSVPLTTSVQSTLSFSLTADLPRVSVDTTPLTATLDFQDQVTHTVVIQNRGSQVLDYTLYKPSEYFGVWRSDEADGPTAAWIDPPPGATRLSLADDDASNRVPLGFPFRFANNTFTQVYISANGMLSFGEPRNQPYQEGCLPMADTPGSAIAPLRLNFDPSLGGTISSAQIDAGFLVTFDQTPLASDPSQLFTFQVLLTKDNRIMFNYKQLGDLPRGASFGLRYYNREAQVLGCGSSLPLTSGLSMELRPQPSTSLWISAADLSGSLAPNETTEVPVTLHWIHPTNLPPYRSTVVVQSSDPRRPEVHIPLEVVINNAPYKQHLPVVSHAR